MAWTGGTRGGGTVGVVIGVGSDARERSGGLGGIEFSKRKHTTAALPPLAASISILELSWGTKENHQLFTQLCQAQQNSYTCLSVNL